MRTRLAARTLALASVLVLFTACSSGSGSQNTGDPCSRLDLSMIGQATVNAYAEAAAGLRSKLGDIEGRVFHACDAMNTTLALARPKNTYDACSTFGARVTQDAGAEITLQISSTCTVDSAARDACEANCQLESCASADCPESAPCSDACAAVGEAGVDCTADTVPVTSGVDAALGNVISLNASEWGTLDSLVAELEPTVTEIGPPMLAYAQTANIISKDEQDCYQDALGNLGVALISFDASRDGLASLPPVFTAPTN